LLEVFEDERKIMTFDEVSHPYLEQFGVPDQTLRISLEDEIYEQYYWYKEDVVAEFVCPKNNRKDGWEISFAFSLDPLKYYRDGE
jgi:hypothetical protein